MIIEIPISEQAVNGHSIRTSMTYDNLAELSHFADDEFISSKLFTLYSYNKMMCGIPETSNKSHYVLYTRFGEFV